MKKKIKIEIQKENGIYRTYIEQNGMMKEVRMCCLCAHEFYDEVYK